MIGQESKATWTQGEAGSTYSQHGQKKDGELGLCKNLKNHVSI